MTDHSEEVITVALRVGALQNEVASLETFAHLGRFDWRKYWFMAAELVAARTLLETLKRGAR